MQNPKLSEASSNSETSDQHDIIRFINWIYSLEVIDSQLELDESNFASSLSDGLVYLKIIEKIESTASLVDWSKVNLEIQNNKFKQLANCNYLISLLDNFVTTPGLAKGRDLVEKRLKSHLSVLWILMRRWFVCTQGHDDEEEFQQMANLYLPSEEQPLEDGAIISYPVIPEGEDHNPLMIILYYGEDGEIFMNYHDDEELDCPGVPHRFDYMCLEPLPAEQSLSAEGQKETQEFKVAAQKPSFEWKKSKGKSKSEVEQDDDLIPTEGLERLQELKKIKAEALPLLKVFEPLFAFSSFEKGISVIIEKIIRIKSDRAYLSLEEYSFIAERAQTVCISQSLTILLEHMKFTRPFQSHPLTPLSMIKHIEEANKFREIPDLLLTTAEFPAATQNHSSPQQNLPVLYSSSKKRAAINKKKYEEPASNYLSNTSVGFSGGKREFEGGMALLEAPCSKNELLANYASCKSGAGGPSQAHSQFCFMSNERGSGQDLYSKRKRHLGFNDSGTKGLESCGKSQKKAKPPVPRERSLQNIQDVNFRSHNLVIKEQSIDGKEKKDSKGSIPKFGVVTREMFAHCDGAPSESFISNFRQKSMSRIAAEKRTPEYKESSPQGKFERPPLNHCTNNSYKLSEKQSPIAGSNSRGKGSLTRKLDYESVKSSCFESRKENISQKENINRNNRASKSPLGGLFKNVNQFFCKEHSQDKNVKPFPPQQERTQQTDLTQDSFLFKLQYQTHKKMTQHGRSKSTRDGSKKPAFQLLNKRSAYIDFCLHDTKNTVIENPLPENRTPVLPFCLKTVRSVEELHLAKRYEILKINRFGNQQLVKRLEIIRDKKEEPQEPQILRPSYTSLLGGKCQDRSRETSITRSRGVSREKCLKKPVVEKPAVTLSQKDRRAMEAAIARPDKDHVNPKTTSFWHDPASIKELQQVYKGVLVDRLQLIHGGRPAFDIPSIDKWIQKALDLPKTCQRPLVEPIQIHSTSCL